MLEPQARPDTAPDPKFENKWERFCWKEHDEGVGREKSCAWHSMKNLNLTIFDPQEGVLTPLGPPKKKIGTFSAGVHGG